MDVRMLEWPTRFKIGPHYKSNILLDGRQPRASRKPRSGSMEDHRLHARNFQNADAKNRVEPQASFQKEPRELLVPFLPPRGEARTGTCSVDGKG